MLKLFKKDHYYYVIDEENRAIGGGKTPLEAACNAADEYYSSGSYFWHLCVAEIIRESDPKILNHWENPFDKI